MAKRRVDVVLVERGLAPNREKARALILAGRVRLREVPLTKAGTYVEEGAELVLEQPLPFVSRGGIKLAHALDAFGLSVQGLVAVDVGAATGGFTDCLLQRGARRVYAIDVGYGQLEYRLRTDPRVVVMERVNARYLAPLPEPVDLATVDVAFISLEKVVPAVVPSLKGEGLLLPLVKPQFELGPGEVGRGGVVRDPALHRRALERFLSWATRQGLSLHGLTPSPILGASGNREFFVWLSRRPSSLELEAALAGLWGTEREPHTPTSGAVP